MQENYLWIRVSRSEHVLGQHQNLQSLIAGCRIGGDGSCHGAPRSITKGKIVTLRHSVMIFSFPANMQVWPILGAPTHKGSSVLF